MLTYWVLKEVLQIYFSVPEKDLDILRRWTIREISARFKSTAHGSKSGNVANCGLITFIARSNVKLELSLFLLPITARAHRRTFTRNLWKEDKRIGVTGRFFWKYPKLHTQPV